MLETVEEENAILKRNILIDHAGFTGRKNQALRDIMTIARIDGLDSAGPACRPLLKRLSSALRENARLLKLHIGAVSEVSDIIIDNLRKVDSDGTYSRHLLPVRS
jgi:hypothetical protein